MARRASKGASDFRGRSLEINPSPAELAATYHGMADKLEDFSALWPRLASQLGLGITQNIKARGATIGERWPQPNRKYARRKLREGFGSTDMVSSGAAVQALGNGTIIRSGKRFLSVGLQGGIAERVIGAHFGYPGGPRPRRFMGFSSQMTSATQRIMDGHIEELTRTAAAELRRAG